MQRRKRHEIEEKDNVAGTGSGGVPAPGTGSSGEEDEPPSKAARFSTTRRRCGAALTSGHGAAGKKGGKGKGKGKKKGSAERAGVGPAPSAPPFGTESVGVQAAEPTPGGASDGAGGPAETEAERRRRKNRAKKAKKKARKQRAAEEEAARREATFIDAAGGSAVTVVCCGEGRRPRWRRRGPEEAHRRSPRPPTERASAGSRPTLRQRVRRGRGAAYPPTARQGGCT